MRSFKSRFDKTYVKDEGKYELRILEETKFEGNVLPHSVEETNFLKCVAKWLNDKERFYIKEFATNVSGLNEYKGGGCLDEVLKYWFLWERRSFGLQPNVDARF